MSETSRRKQVCRVCRGLVTPETISFFMGRAAEPQHTLHTPVTTRQSGPLRKRPDQLRLTFARPRTVRGGVS